ncbi:MAG TPA: tetratricopeptide repeat protein [Allosphingosinicella sp.]
MATITAVVGLCLASCAQAQSTELAQKLEKAAQSGDPEASYHLGMIYNNGIGVTQDAKRAFAHFSRAAEAGDPLGAYKVGCYYAGQFEGVVKADEEQALRHKLKAAEAGYKLAQVDVAIIYARREDNRSALKWFEAAAKQGDAQSLYNLSVFYRDGLGTAPSRPKTHAFFRLAHIAARGNVGEGAQKQLDEIAAAMSAEERAEAERIAATWITGPTPLTQLAAAGLDRAQVVAAKSR